MASDNKRTSRRAPVVLRIKLRYTSVDSFVSKFATNLSPGGMFISSRAPKPMGTRLKFELRLADNSSIICGTGVVRWTQLYDAEHPRRLYGMGIEFEEISPESHDLIERVVEHKRTLGLSDDDRVPTFPIRARRSPANQATTSDTLHSTAEPAAPAVPAVPEVQRSDRSDVANSVAPTLTDLWKRAAVPTNEDSNVRDADKRDDTAELDSVDQATVARALERARQLASDGRSEGDDLDSLLKIVASPVAHSVRDASAQLSALLGARPVAEIPTTAPSSDPHDTTQGMDQADDAARSDNDTAPNGPTDETPVALALDQRNDTSSPSGSDIAADVIPPTPPTESSELPSKVPPPVPSASGSTRVVKGGNAMLLDAGESFVISSSGSIDLNELADQLLESDGEDALGLDADALDAEGLLASGVGQLTTPRRRRTAPLDLPEDAPGLSSFADPPTHGGDEFPDTAKNAKTVHAADENSEDDELDATLAALGIEPDDEVPGESDFEQSPLTRAEPGLPAGLLQARAEADAMSAVERAPGSELDDEDIDIDFALDDAN